MSKTHNRKLENIIFKGLPGAVAVFGGLFLLIYHFVLDSPSMPILAGFFTEQIPVPLNFFRLGTDIISIEVENFLLFQTFESFIQVLNSKYSIFLGAVYFILIALGISLISSFKKMYFIGGAAFIIFFLTFSGLNGLNIGGIATNYPLIGMITAILIPISYISFFKPDWGLVHRFTLLVTCQIIGFGILMMLTSIEAPFLYISEQVTLPLTVVCSLFLLHIGHAVISGSSIFLLKINQGAGLKISWHITVISILYFALVLFTLLDLMGEVNLPFPTLPPLVLMFVAGIIGYFVLDQKINQTEQVFDSPTVGKSLYLIGFALTTLIWGKAVYTYNQPLVEFFNHIFLYGQIALSLLFFAYLMTNFSSIINNGSALDQVIFKPRFFAYFHMRIGAIMSLVILVIFADAIIATQLNSASLNLSADYYYQTGRPQHARILYENSWAQYIKNDRAKNTVAHLYILDKQPSAAIRQLEESFDYAPNVPNILLLSARLHQANRILEAIFYLEKGLEYFPNNPYLTNNLALFYSKTNKGSEAIRLLLDLKNSEEVAISNLVGLSIKHLFPIEEDFKKTSDPITQINLLALENKNGNLADIQVAFDQLPKNDFVLSTGIRNQWTNQSIDDYDVDLTMIDSLINQTANVSLERNYRDSKIIRVLQENQINEALKYLSGAVFNFPNQSDTYQVIAAEVLASQLDFEKAAKELVLAAAVQSSRIKPIHLAILYFGGRPDVAFTYHQKFELDFPSWMIFNEAGNLAKTPQAEFFSILTEFHSKTADYLLDKMINLDNNNLKVDLAYFILIHKGHWLDKEQLALINTYLTEGQNAIWTKDDFQSFVDFLFTQKETELSTGLANLIKPKLSTYRNAYFTPLLFKGLAEVSDPMLKYEILQEAIQYNKDPKLWLAFVNQSRVIGLENYGTRALDEMKHWISKENLEKLLIENQE
ncbi:hypothetical protein SAMN06295967_10180 [Belliella buryatensis]|uniref:Tetratricopeptide repeat-containing protein n=1 Tax=Belliella buryatensis TaxID=1500549 RepID=A0A239AEM8_9BACT|nr:hypothetical protein [Belliella buryatensis]SNR93822.1 hypothetical protein SAMN06295967_10180 [Belliella buryatensis]